MKSIKSCLFHLLNPLFNQANYSFSSSKFKAKINSYQKSPQVFFSEIISDIKVLFSPHQLGREYVMLNIIK